MQVIFIHHSCFLVEVDEKVLIFDWFDGDRVEGYHFGGVLPEYEPDTPVYVFASHKHRDHFESRRKISEDPVYFFKRL